MTDEDTRALVDAIDALLPQTQCTRCGYAGCRPYAAAVASGEADINQCPPGGDATIRALAFKRIRVLFRCWVDRTPYNESRYLDALQKRRSPLLKFAAASAS